MRSSINWLDSWQETNLRWSLTIGPRVDWLMGVDWACFMHLHAIFFLSLPSSGSHCQLTWPCEHDEESPDIPPPARQGRLVLVAPRTADISCQANKKCQEMSMKSGCEKKTHLCVVFMLFGIAKIGSGVGRISYSFRTAPEICVRHDVCAPSRTQKKTSYPEFGTTLCCH